MRDHSGEAHIIISSALAYLAFTNPMQQSPKCPGAEKEEFQSEGASSTSMSARTFVDTRC